MKKLIFLILLANSAQGQDTTLKPEIKHARIKPVIFIGAGTGYNHLKTNRYQAIQTRSILYFSGGFTVKRWTFQANIGNSIVSTSINYYFR